MSPNESRATANLPGGTTKVEYSLDAQKWIRLVPVDGIADSSDETYKVRRADVAGKHVIIRAVDAFYNVATQSIVP